VAAFSRSAGDQLLVVTAPIQIATRLRGNMLVPIGSDVWRDDALLVPDGAYDNLFTGRSITTDERGVLRLADVFADFPVAALLKV
jgi:maltooligosyltrehalose synthase